MITTGLNLLIPDKPDVERDAVAEAFESCGGTVYRIARFWDPPHFESSTVRVYGADTFCLVLQQKLGFTLHSPSDDLLLTVPAKFLNRQAAGMALGETPFVDFPAFIKPVVPKQFRGKVYESSAALAAECRGLPPDTPVLVAEAVAFTAEVRSFALDGVVLDAAVYEGSAGAAGAREFVEALTQSMSLPRAVVVDVGLIDGCGWAVVEFNAAWGAGLNGCEAEKVLPAIVAASGPHHGSKP